ncbi:MAG: di/tricarboxylate transporter [Pseudomonadales bacterium]|jgi:di/tricarboxylate transporter
MEIDSLLTLATIVVCFSMLIFTRLAADGVLLGGVVFLMLFRVLSVDDALAGFSNEGVATVAILYVVAYALSATGVVSWMSQSILGRPKTIRSAQLRLMLPVALFSSVLNNTPVVAMMVPAVSDWARRMKMPASQLMMPLSFAAIIGGVCTLIGTSTNLVINGMLIELQLEEELALFDLAWVGIPCVVAVIGFILLTSKWLLPYKQGAAARFEDARQYTVEMLVEKRSPLAGKSIEQAGLRHLSGLYLAEIVRDGDIIRVGPTRYLREEDRLIFVGNVDAVVDLKQIRGLVSAEQQVFKLDDKSIGRSLIEVVISREFPLLRKTVKESEFRKFYGAVIIAVSRNGHQIKQRIGDLILEPGDTLLLEANSEFVEKQRFAKDFLVVSPVADFQPVESKKQWVALSILVGMIATASVGLLSMFEAAVVATCALIATGCISVQAARKKISWHIIVIIAASLALGKAMTNSGLAYEIANILIGTVSSSPELTLLAMFVLTAVFSAIISNVAAAVILFPIAVSAAESMGLNVLPFAVMIMVAASASFATPIGYQTNLMVYGPGDYQFSDFLRLGVPLTIIVGVVSYIVIPIIWPL